MVIFSQKIESPTIPGRFNVSRAHFWDVTAVAAIDKVIIKFRREGTEVELIGLNEASQAMIDNFGVRDKPDAEQSLGAH
ncbi:STAS domain-containing protein [Psychrobacter sp. Ps1]|nr:STAS domain-containing protein [Psychrobacter sp. Ps1]